MVFITTNITHLYSIHITAFIYFIHDTVLKNPVNHNQQQHYQGRHLNSTSLICSYFEIDGAIMNIINDRFLIII